VAALCFGVTQRLLPTRRANGAFGGMTGSPRRFQVPMSKETILWAHLAQTSHFDRLVARAALSIRSVEVEEEVSVDGALASLNRPAPFRPTLVLASLDLPKAPQGAAIVARAALAQGVPAIFLGLGSRWVAEDLRALPTLDGEATSQEFRAAWRRAKAILRQREERTSLAAPLSLRESRHERQGCADPM
jgi:hypothetical protein